MSASTAASAWGRADMAKPDSWRLDAASYPVCEVFQTRFQDMDINGHLNNVAFAALFESGRSEEHTSELQSLMRISYAVFCLKKKTQIEHHWMMINNLHLVLRNLLYESNEEIINSLQVR